MHMRAFTFSNDANGRTDFFVLYQAVRQIDPDKATKDERPYIAAALRTLDRISDPIGEAPADADEFTVDLRQRKLRSGDPTVIEISQKLHDRMATWVDTAKFQAAAMVAVEDFCARWSQAEKFERSDESGEPSTPGVVAKLRRK